MEKIKPSEEAVTKCGEGGSGTLRYSDSDFNNHDVAPGRGNTASDRGGSCIFRTTSNGSR